LQTRVVYNRETTRARKETEKKRIYKRIGADDQERPYTRRKRKNKGPNGDGDCLSSSASTAIVLGSIFEKVKNDVLKDAEIFIDSKNIAIHSFT
jgi:hypothetical protein